MTITELQKVLGEQLARLNDIGLIEDALAEEIKRADAMCRISGQLIGNGRLALDVQKALTDGTADRTQLPMLGD